MGSESAVVIVRAHPGRRARTVECPGHARPPRRPEVRRLVRGRRRPHPARRAADRPRARGRQRPRRRRVGDGRHDRRAARRSPRRSPTIRTRASSTCCSRPASTRARRSCRWPSTRWASGAISLTGPQAGITTDGRYGRARIAGIEPRRVRAELEAGKVVIVAGFQGQSASRRRRRRDHDARSRRQRHDRGRARRQPGRRPLPDLHRRARHLHRRSAARSARPASWRSSATRRCSSSPTRAPRSCRSGRSSSAGSTASSSRS